MSSNPSRQIWRLLLEYVSANWNAICIYVLDVNTDGDVNTFVDQNLTLNTRRVSCIVYFETRKYIHNKLIKNTRKFTIMIMLHENIRLVIVAAESFNTIHITQQNFGLPVRQNDKIVRKITYYFS